MSKKFTSFVVLLAALLLTLPTQAQTLVKRSNPFEMKGQQAITLKQQKAAKAAQQKALDKTVGIAFRGGKAAVEAPVTLTAEEAKAQKEAWAARNGNSWNWQAHAVPQYVSTSGLVKSAGQFLYGKPVASRIEDFMANSSKHQFAPSASVSRRAQGDPNAIITELPATAEVKYYQRSGSYYYYNNVYSVDAQSGRAQIAFDGNDVYFKDILAGVIFNSWVKGTKSGNTITVPLGQFVNFSAAQGYGLYLTMANVAAAGNSFSGENVTEATEITYTIDGDKIVQNGTSENYTLTVAWSDDNTVFQYGAPGGEFGTVYTLEADYVPPTLITLPEGAEVEQWRVTGQAYRDMAAKANVAFVENDVYVQGLFSYLPNGWIKGTLNGTTVTFEGAQYVGTLGSYDIYAIGGVADENDDVTLLPAFTMTYDAEAKTLKLDESNMILANASTTETMMYDYIVSLSIYKPGEVKPAVAPYTADFTYEEGMANFQILDANGDATEDGNGTWNWSSTNGAYYKYSSANAADDYLILPIILEGGKGYDVTINAASNGAYYPEKFEVVWGLAPTKEALTNVIIPETTLSSDEWTDFTGSFSSQEAGQYYVAIHAISDADQFLLKVMKMSVEVGAEATAPAAVENLTIAQVEGVLQTAVSFTAPTKNVGGSDLTANLTKIELVRNGEVVKSFEDVAPGAVVEYVDELPAMGSYAYQVIPYNADGIGVKSEVVRVFAVTTLDVPYTADFTQEGCLDFFQTIDANGDGRTWAWSSNYHAYCDYNTDLAADDYLVSLPINLKAGKNYDVNINAFAYSDAYAERLEVVLGNAATAEALTTVILPAVELTSSTPEDFSAAFTVEADGAYYIAIHAISDANSWYPVVNSLTVEQGAEPQAPAAPALAVQPAAEGALSAAVSVVAPTQTREGKSLIGKVDVDILVNGETYTTLQGVTVGAQTTLDVEVEAAGVYTFQAVASNRYGKGLKSEKLSAFIGTDTPADVENFHVVSTTANTVTFAWDEVKGVHGGYVNPATMLYEISTLAVEEGFFGAYLVVDQTIASVTGQTQLTVDFAGIDEGDLAYQYFGISANDGVAATDATYAYTYLLKGAPYELPVVEGFANSTLHYAWESNGGLGVSNESSDEDGVALQLYNEGAADDIYFSLQKVNVVPAANPTLLFDVKSGSVDKIAAIGSVDGAEMQTIAEADVTEEYTTVKVPLTNLKGQRYTSVGLLANMPEFTEFDPWSGAVISMGDYVVIDNIRIVDLYEYDLKVALKAPASVKAGEKATITATVTNEGENAAEGYNIVIKAGEKELLNTAVNEVLEPFKSNVIEAELETTIFDDAADVTITAEVSYELDLNEENNSAETIVSIKESSVAQPETVAAQEGENGVELTWTAPETSAAEQVEDVEAYEEFDCGGLSAEVHTGKIGEWTVYDGNGTYNYGFNGLTVPNLGEPNAWIVMAPASAQLAQDISADYGAHSGGQYFMSACTAEPESAPAATDHWLISPELPGIAQTISFYARELTTNYGAETYEVLASATDTDAASFTVVATGAVDATEWTLYTAELPAGTKYFAIRHTSVDVFGMMVDDITYLAGAAEVTAFNIYVDGELFATVSGDVTTYTVGGLSEGEHTFAISAVTATGESKPVEVVLSVVTGIQQIAAEGQPVDVYSLDGKLVRKQTKSLNGLKGVYVINGKAVIVK